MSVDSVVQVVFLDQFRPVVAKYLPQEPFLGLIIGNSTRSSDNDLLAMVKSLNDHKCNAIIFSGPEATRLKDERINGLKSKCPISFMAGNNFQDILGAFTGNNSLAQGALAIIVVGQGQNLMKVLAEIKTAGIKLT
mgnify:CR=1 FL=1